MTKQQTYRRILVSPLNWGLGHATRLVPVVNALIKDGHYVLLAGESPALDILKQTFPQLDCVGLPGFNVQLAKGRHQWLKLLTQTPKLLKSIRKEQQVTQSIVRKYNINLILSDNRYGVYSRSVPSVILTHQTTPYTGESLSFLRPLSNLISRLWLKRFNECWIPDFNGEHNLSGSLSQTVKGLPCKYIGLLSRLSLVESPATTRKADILVILSGPEPQRKELETLLIQQLKDSQLKTILLSGQPNVTQKSIGAIELLPHCSAQEQKGLILNCRYIICRSGYSTLMDLLHCQRTALLIPTPGQFEQEYLAQRASQLGFTSISQEQLRRTSLEKHLLASEYLSTNIMVADFKVPSLPQ